MGVDPTNTKMAIFIFKKYEKFKKKLKISFFRTFVGKREGVSNERQPLGINIL